MWFTVPGILLLFLYVNPTVSKDICSNVAMKEAILNLARIVKDNGQKLERHEARERQLGDYINKTVGDLNIKVPPADTVATYFTTIEEQLSQIQQLISQRDERERIQMQKTADMIERLENRLEEGLNDMKNTITEVSKHVAPTEPPTTAESVSPLDIILKLNDTEAQLLQRIARIDSNLGDMAHQNEEDTAKQAKHLQTIFNERDEKDKIQIQKTVKLIQNLESRLEARLNDINNTIHEIDEQNDAKAGIQGEETAGLIQNLENTLETRLGKINDTIHGVDEQGDARDKIQAQETVRLIQNLENRLEMQLQEINNTIHEVNEHVEPTQPTTTTESVLASDIISKLTDTEAHFLEKVSEIESKLNGMVTKNENDVNKQSENLENIYSQVQNITGRLEEIETSLEKSYEAAQREAAKPKEKPVDIEPIIKEQTKALQKVTELVEHTVHRMNELPTTFEILNLHNETQTALQEPKVCMDSTVEDKLDRLISNVSENNEQIKDAVGSLRLGLADNADQVNARLVDIAKSQVVMVPMADQVMDMRPRLEFGIQQILSEVGSSVNISGTEININLNERLDELSKDIIENNSKSISNLTIKVEQELEQIWRQLNVMDQQITGSASILTKLNEQNEAYFNGTISTMNGMDTKVGEVNRQISKVDEDLNYSLQRLSLVTQEFSAIKSGLGTALDDIKASFRKIKAKADDLTNPGPYPLPDGHQEPGFDSIESGTVTRPNEPHKLGDIEAN